MSDLISATTPTLRILVVGACVVGLVLGAIYLGSTKEKEKMTVAKTGLAPKAAISPLDASAPTKTETATFALG